MQENMTHYCACLTQGDLPQDAQEKMFQKKAAVLKNARWQSGEQILIRFLEGSRELQERVRDVAQEWMKIANLNLEFVQEGPTDIRIAFEQGNGSWSYLGTMCRNIGEPEPTMNYGWLTPYSEDDELRRVVLHEFGHAIGLIHEHQNPDGGIHWNKPAVIHDLSGPPNNWSLPTIENNIFKRYEKKELDSTKLDSKSIMMYPIPKAWTLDQFSAGLNGEISEVDKQLIREVYPR